MKNKNDLKIISKIKKEIIPRVNKRNLQLYRTYVETGMWTKKQFKDKTGIDY